MLRRGRCGLARPPRRRRVDGSLIRNSESASRVARLAPSPALLNVIFGSFWALIMVVAAVCGLIGAQVFNGCLVVT